MTPSSQSVVETVLFELSVSDGWTVAYLEPGSQQSNRSPSSVTVVKGSASLSITLNGEYLGHSADIVWPISPLAEGAKVSVDDSKRVVCDPDEGSWCSSQNGRLDIALFNRSNGAAKQFSDGVDVAIGISISDSEDPNDPRVDEAVDMVEELTIRESDVIQ